MKCRRTQSFLANFTISLPTITNPTNNWISRSIVGITTKSSVKLSSHPTTRFIKSVVLSFPTRFID
ncbi:hypothetical protein Lepto1489_01380 [Leptospira interrogans serovar Bataviae]|uniref:Uncharacterized protein n=1 Tax=Leptospira interrogans serovar Bataviae TaxID=312175 RepID=A0AAQ0B0L1_LEPIR|nr:hypothetical protein Lepto1489_01380 [Leptospira interrogans serovar Bataviae]